MSVFDFVLARGVFAVIRPDNLSAALPLAEVHHHDPSRARSSPTAQQKHEGDGGDECANNPAD